MSEVSTTDERTINGFGTFKVPPGSENEPAIAVKVTHRGEVFWAVLFNKGGNFYPVLDDIWNESVRGSEGNINITVEENHITVTIVVSERGCKVHYSSQVAFSSDRGIILFSFKHVDGEPGV